MILVCSLILICLKHPRQFCGIFYQHSVHVNKKDILHAISGSIGSALSITLLYPLETVRTRLQVDTSLTPHSSFLIIFNIGKREGIQGLYKGWFSLVVALMALNFVYFYSFQSLRRWENSIVDGSINKVVVDLTAGYLAGVSAVLVTGPLWLVNTRIKLQGLKLQGVNIGRAGASVESKQNTNKQYTGILHCIYRISNEEGILTLWHGTFTSIILSLNPAIQLGVYEMLKRHHLVIGSGNSSGSLEPFVNALIAKFVATVITYPIQVLQTRHRAGIKKEEAQSPPDEIWYSALKRLYRGLESKLLQTCLNSGLMFVAYERLVDILTTLVL